MHRDEIEHDARALHRVIAGLARPAKTTPIPRPLRTQVVALATRAAASGWSQAAVATAVGVSVASLHNWRRAPTGPMSLVPVVVDPPGRAELIVVAPSGHRVEGLDVATTAALLRALG